VRAKIIKDFQPEERLLFWEHQINRTFSDFLTDECWSAAMQYVDDLDLQLELEEALQRHWQGLRRKKSAKQMELSAEIRSIDVVMTRSKCNIAKLQRDAANSAEVVVAVQP
jgi:hypothetical protein